MTDVKITRSPDEAQFYEKNKIPYIAVLNDENRAQSFPSGAYCVENEADISDDYKEKVYQRFMNLPWNITETKRLKIREITEADVPRLYELYADESVTKYIEPLFDDIEKEIEYIRSYIQNIYHFYGYGMWVIVLKKSGEVIGRVGFEDKDGRDGLEIGFMLGAAYQHKGYAYEACTAAIEYAKGELGADRIYAVVCDGNEASVRLCQRLGIDCIKTPAKHFSWHT